MEDAIKFCRDRGLEFYAVNSNYPPGALFGDSRQNPVKVIADLYIDDRNLGGLPDWGTIYEMITGIRTERQKRRKGLRGRLNALFKK